MTMSKTPRPEDMHRAWLQIAVAEMGTREYAGTADNPEVLKYFEDVTDLPDRLTQDDETDWCSAFVNWVVTESGVEGSRSGVARSWMRWGIPIHVPEPGCIVVLWRGSREDWRGHVGFWVSETDRYVLILGGNQGSAVTVKKYAIDRILGYRTYG